jgi:hypothetical protein
MYLSLLLCISKYRIILCSLSINHMMEVAICAFILELGVVTNTSVHVYNYIVW